MIKTILKFLFAGTIIFWMIRKGEIDFSLVVKSFDHYQAWATCIIILLVNEILTSLRWKTILEIKTKAKLPFLKIVKLTWIGMFFSSVLPGAVTGDLIKMVYAKPLNPNLTRSFLLTSVMFDRIIGLIGLIFLLGGTSIFFYSEMINLSPDIKEVVAINFFLLFGAVIFLATIFLPEKINTIFISLVKKTPFIGKKLEDLFRQVWLVGNDKKAVLKCLGLSVFSQGLTCIALWSLASPFIESPLPLRFAFSFIPLGLISIAIPITPAGLGVGHAIFGTLFSYFGTKSGASIFNLFFIAIQGINLLGVFPFLTTNRKEKINLQKQTTS